MKVIRGKRPHEVIGEVPVDPPFNRMEENLDVCGTHGEVVTNGHWMIMLKYAPGIRKAKLQKPREYFDMIMKSAPEEYSPMGNPLYGGGGLYAWDAIVEYGIDAKYYNWIVFHLGLNIGKGESDMGPFPIFDNNLDRVGVLMPVRVRGEFSLHELKRKRVINIRRKS